MNSTTGASNVLACIDFSDLAGPVLDTAAQLAVATAGTVHLLHVAAEEPELVGYDHDRIATFTRDDRARQLLDEHHALRDRAAQLAEDGLTVNPHLVMGPTVDTILAEADRLDVAFIVAGSHGHGGLHHLLLGSVSEELVRRATRPVVLVPVVRR